MSSVRSGKTATLTAQKNSNEQAAEDPTAKNLPSSASKKRKAQDDPEDDKENVDPPSTPPPASSKVENKQYERTPGRVGPIKSEDFSLKPDIKPFKGPPGKKVRKTAWEKNQEYVQFALENEGHCFHELYKCFKKGPQGSPTYDKAGFELDYEKVARWMEPKPYNKASMMKNMDRSINRMRDDERRMAEIFFEKGEAPANPEYSIGASYWKDRVSKDLGVPWHKIEVGHFEE